MPLIEAVPDALARVYAAALFDLAKAGGGKDKAEEILGELEDILELTRANPKFGEFLASLIVPAKDRTRSLGQIFKGRISDVTLHFLQVVNQKNRLGHLPAIVAAFVEMVQQAFGRVEVDVYTAAPIDQNEVREIRERLQTILRREPVVHAYVEPAMIGGIKVQIGDQLIDSSVRSSLRKMRDQISTQGSSAIRTQADKLIEG